jgi:2-polyprenyl-6-methoxyphenol hydroxylase-like FAD-dependent oxidoreductase
MENRNILISGAGIAGTTLAFWLKKSGFNPTIIEHAPKLREGGYAIDFMGAGYTVAEKMGIIPALEKSDINISKVAFVDQNNNEKGSMNYRKIKELLNNRAFTLLRSDLAKVIYESLHDGVEIIFGDTIDKIEQSKDHVLVTMRSGKSRLFDLVVGADGLHSNVRKIIFGNESQFEQYYGYYTSSYTLENFPTNDRAFSMCNVPGKQAAVYEYSETRTATFFAFTLAEKLKYDHHDVEKQKQILKNEFMGMGWKCPEILSRIDSSTDFYFDPISQIKMDKWSKGRITLVGDACYCPSLLSGKGSTLAMAGAYILAGELKLANGNYETAFMQYENIFKPFISKKQKSAEGFAKSFIPKSKFGIWVRNQALKLMSFPLISKLYLNQFNDKELTMKEY